MLISLISLSLILFSMMGIIIKERKKLLTNWTVEENWQKADWIERKEHEWCQIDFSDHFPLQRFLSSLQSCRTFLTALGFIDKLMKKDSSDCHKIAFVAFISFSTKSLILFDNVVHEDDNKWFPDKTTQKRQLLNLFMVFLAKKFPSLLFLSPCVLILCYNKFNRVFL